jgi:hypothetical protein
MDNLASAKLLFFVAIFFAVCAGGIWVIFLRTVPLLTARGTITNKTFKPAGTYWQYPAGLSRGFRTATRIPIAESYVFEVKVDGFDSLVFYSLNTIASQAFDIGKKVQIRYQERDIPFIWKRVYVVDMSAE